MLCRLTNKEIVAFVLAAVVILGPLAAATTTRHADLETVKQSGARVSIPPGQK
jgi:hypothetical protein